MDPCICGHDIELHDVGFYRRCVVSDCGCPDYEPEPDEVDRDD